MKGARREFNPFCSAFDAAKGKRWKLTKLNVLPNIDCLDSLTSSVGVCRHLPLANIKLFTEEIHDMRVVARV